MSMTDCWECGAPVNDTDARCPKCRMRPKKPKRGFFVTMLKWEFILFNCMMVAWLVTKLGGLSGVTELSPNEITQVNPMNYSTLSTVVILITWAIGDIILGLFMLLTLPRRN